MSKTTRFILVIVVGIILGFILSCCSAQQFPWDPSFPWSQVINYCILSIVVSKIFEIQLFFESDVSDTIGKRIPKYLLRPNDGDPPEGSPMFVCKAATSDEILFNFLRKNWEFTIQELWQDNKDIIDKLTTNHLSALRIKENGFFDKRVTRFIKNGKVGFIFINPECDINHYALWAKIFELSAKESLLATNILLPSELFSAKNRENTIKHAIAFNENNEIKKIRLQIFTDDIGENGNPRNEDTFNKEINESNLSDVDLLCLYSELDPDKSKSINEQIKDFEIKNKKKITPGDLYNLYFLNTHTDNKIWIKEKKENLGSMYFGDYVIIDEEIILRYSKEIQTLELLCGEIVEKFTEYFEPYLKFAN